MRFRFTQDFDLSPEAFWDVFWSDGYSEALYRQLGTRSRKVLAYVDDGETIRRVQRIEPDVPLPAWAAARLKSTAYTEHDLYIRRRSLMEVRIEPEARTARFQMGGVQTVTQLGPGRCRREFLGEVRVEVPLLGVVIERRMVEQLRAAFEAGARVMGEGAGPVDRSA